MTQEEIQRLEDFATDIISTHAKLEHAIEQANKDGVKITQKLLSLYVEVKSLIRKHTKPQGEDNGMGE